MNQRPRQIDDTEFLEAFGNLTKRLDLHISNMDQGHTVVRDDLAGSLRTLFCRGKGNDAIRRFCSRFSLSEPEVRVTPPITKTGNLQFGFTALLIDGEDSKGTTITVPSQLSEAVCVLVRHKNVLHRFKWEEVVEAYGNTFGSHLSTTIPHLFEKVNIYGLGHVDFGSYMLRNLAIIISDCCHNLISEKTGELFQPHSRYFNGIQVSQALYYRKRKKDDLQTMVKKENWKLAGKIMSVRSPEGNNLNFSITEGGRLSLSVQKAI